MSLRSYPEYKDSGVEWLGEIPAHWDTRRIKTVVQEVNRRSRDESGVLLSLTRARGLVPQSELTNRGLTAQTLVGYKICNPVEIVMNRMQAWSGMFAEASEQGLISPDYAVFTPLFDANSTYLVNLFKTPLLVEQFANASRGIGTGFNRLYSDQFGAIFIPLPPPDEQAAIVTFLDAAEKRIRRYIRAKQKFIKLLTEQKQAIIQQAVTRGLDPDAPMKDSGVEWLGEIPAHWEVRSFRRLAHIVRGASPRPAGDPRLFYGDFIPWVTVGEITKDDEIYLVNTRSALTELGATQSRLMRKDTLVITNSGATLGVPKILSIDVCANDGVVAFEDLSNDINSVFAYYYLSSLTQRLRDELKQGGTQPNLNTDLIKAIGCPLPPIDEQIYIVEYLQNALTDTQLASKQAREAIALILEYRMRLTADVVTGKVDVRGLAFEMPEDFDESDLPEVDEDELFEDDESILDGMNELEGLDE